MSLRPANPSRITFADLAAGDVLLSCGDNELDHLITLVDQGDYSHASLVADRPENARPTVVEATLGGIQYNSIDKDMDAQYLVDAYRYVSPRGDHFGRPGWPVAPVTDAARQYVGGPYGYSEALMAGVVLLAAEASHANPDLAALIRLAAIVLADGLERWVEGTRKRGKQGMTCVQVVAEAFWQAPASPSNKYGLQVEMVRPSTLASRSLPSVAEVEEWRGMRTRIEAAVRTAMPQQRAVRPAVTAELAAAGEEGLVLTAGGPYLPAGMCTLRDLETSPTLQFLGCLKDSGLRRIPPTGR